MTWTRRELLAWTGRLAGSVALGAALWRCGDSMGSDSGSTPSDNTSGDCATNGTQVSIAANHGHVMQVSVDDVTAGVEKTYDIQGSAAHTHLVTLTAAHFAELAMGNSVTVTSTSGAGHTHLVSVSCA